jgi:tripartite-type tricarboxylate transporter receptor subunit TctC
VFGVTTTGRSALVPDAPPIAETLPGFDVGSWNGLFAPAGTPKDIVARLARETEQILARPEIRSRLAGIGFEVAPLGSEALGRYVREQLQHWGRLVREAGIQPE